MTDPVERDLCRYLRAEDRAQRLSNWHSAILEPVQEAVESCDFNANEICKKEQLRTVVEACKELIITIEGEMEVYHEQKYF